MCGVLKNIAWINNKCTANLLRLLNYQNETAPAAACLLRASIHNYTTASHSSCHCQKTQFYGNGSIIQSKTAEGGPIHNYRKCPGWIFLVKLFQQTIFLSPHQQYMYAYTTTVNNKPVLYQLWPARFYFITQYITICIFTKQTTGINPNHFNGNTSSHYSNNKNKAMFFFLRPNNQGKHQQQVNGVDCSDEIAFKKGFRRAR